MLKCKLNGMCDKCIIDMDAFETMGGMIGCDTAEDLDFNRIEILRKCKYAESDDINNAALNELCR